MTDLTDFGVEVSDTTTDESDEPDQSRSYPNGRCPAIATGTRRRCAAPVSRMNATGRFCGTHGRSVTESWSIDDPAEKLILITGELDAMSLDELDPSEVSFDLGRIREAVDAVDGRWSP